MSFISDVRESIYGVIKDAVPGITEQWDFESVNRFNWRKRFEKFRDGAPGGLEPPWVVVLYGEANPTDGAVDSDNYEIKFAIYYITTRMDFDANDAKHLGPFIEEIEDALQNLAHAFRTSSAFAGTVIDLQQSISEGLAPNEYFSQYNIHLWAGCMIMTTVAGWTPEWS